MLNSQQQFEKVREGFKSKFVEDGNFDGLLYIAYTPLGLTQRPLSPLVRLLFSAAVFAEKLEKEKNRYAELEKASDAQQLVIDKLSEEHEEVARRNRELHEQMLTDRESALDAAREEWEDEQNSRLEGYTSQIHGLQNEVNELLNEQAAHEAEYNQWQAERSALVKKFEEKDEELQRAMEDLEHLNSENAEYSGKIEACESAIAELRQESNEFEESRVKFR